MPLADVVIDRIVREWIDAYLCCGILEICGGGEIILFGRWEGWRRDCVGREVLRLELFRSSKEGGTKGNVASAAVR